MKKSEIKKAEKMINEFTERTSTLILQDGQCLSVEFCGGGSRIFYTIDEVEDWIRERQNR